jgi:hypothetical protein
VDASRYAEVGVVTKMTVEDAARSLGIKEESVRKRVRRGKLRSEKDEDGRLYVYVDASKTVRDEYMDEPRDVYPNRYEGKSRSVAHELIESEDETIRILQDQLQKEREARRRADTIIAQLAQANATLAQRVPGLEAPFESGGTLRTIAREIVQYDHLEKGD